MPVDKGFYVTSPFGPRWDTTHFGTDFGVTGGSGGRAVYAIKAGTVTRSGPASGFGRWVTVDHPASNGGGLSVYGHVIPEVSVGQRVSEGQRIARIDPSRATNGGVDPHLHLEFHRYVWSPPGPDRLDPMATVLRGAAWPGDAAVSTRVISKTDGIFDEDWSRRFWEHGSSKSKRAIFIHTTENGDTATARSVALWQLGPENNRNGSYHGLVDRSGFALRCNSDDQNTYSTGNKGNQVGLHLSFVAFSSWTREKWLSEEKMLRRGAKVVADWCQLHGIPVIKRDGVELRAGKWGIAGHDDARIAWGVTDHTDPGKNFPWDVFLRYVEEATEKDKPKGGESVTFKEFTDFIKGYFGPQIDALQDVWTQLRGPSGRGWPQLGRNERGESLTLVDGVAALRRDVAELSKKIDLMGEKR